MRTSHPARKLARAVLLATLLSALLLLGTVHPDGFRVVLGLGVPLALLATLVPDSFTVLGALAVTAYLAWPASTVVDLRTLALALLMLAAHLVAALLGVGPETVAWPPGIVRRWARTAASLAGLTVATWALLVLLQDGVHEVGLPGLLLTLGCCGAAGWWAYRAGRPETSD